jgi:hypothetical protein
MWITFACIQTRMKDLDIFPTYVVYLTHEKDTEVNLEYYRIRRARMTHTFCMTQFEKGKVTPSLKYDTECNVKRQVTANLNMTQSKNP